MRDDFIELVEVTQLSTGLKKGIIEKDYHVTHLICILSKIQSDFLNLVFAGGTCLAKGHRLTKRMSEDVDFKMQYHASVAPLNKSKFRVEFRRLREQIVNAVGGTEFEIKNESVEGHGTHAHIEIGYPMMFPGERNIRPFIQLELTMSDIKMPTHNLLINSLIQDVVDVKNISDSCLFECVSVEETAAEKWVALTRRVAWAIRNPGQKEDVVSALVRHIYDLFVIARESRLGKNFIPMSGEIVCADQKKYKDQHIEYYEDPVSEIHYSLELLQDKRFIQYYNNLIEALVYEEHPPSYSDALEFINDISHQVLNIL